MIYVLVPGAWTGAWLWDWVVKRLSKKGHAVYSLTLSGLNRGDDATPITLAKHVWDVVDFLEARGFKQVILVGHSYSGLVVGQAAAQRRELVHHEEHSGSWPPPTRDELDEQPFLNPDHVELLASKMVGHPGQTITDPAVLPKSLSAMPSTFIAEKGWLAGSRQRAR